MQNTKILTPEFADWEAFKYGKDFKIFLNPSPGFSLKAEVF